MQSKFPRRSSSAKSIQTLSLLLNFPEGENQTDEPSNLLTQFVARRRVQEYLADPSIGIPYEEFHRRMVAEGVLDE